MNVALLELPKLEARECLLAVNVLQIGTGKMKLSRARDVLATWQRESGKPRARKARSEKEWLAGLAARGIGFRVADGRSKAGSR